MQTIMKGSRGKDVKTLQNLLHLFEDGIFGVVTEEAVKDVQQSHGLVADGIVGEKTWAMLLNQDEKIKKSKRTINELIIHCTATQEGKDYTAADITRWHKLQGWATIGYHYVVYLDGSIHEGRDIDVVGAHCLGHNAHSLGIVYVGGLASDGKTAKDTRTPRQKEALVNLLKLLRAIYPKAKIYGHRDFAQKSCPCFNAKEEYKNI